MISTSHTFNVWHPSSGGLPNYQETEFGFDRAVSRTEARRIVEDVEGYVIEKKQRQKTGPYIHKPRPRKQKVR